MYYTNTKILKTEAQNLSEMTGNLHFFVLVDIWVLITSKLCFTLTLGMKVLVISLLLCFVGVCFLWGLVGFCFVGVFLSKLY
jgi:hypothetical protein